MTFSSFITMGSKISQFLKRIFDYPIKKKPICFYRSQDFTTTGEPILKDSDSERVQLTEYDKLLQSFYNRLAQEQDSELSTTEGDNKINYLTTAEQFDGWDDATISNLHNMFLLFDNNMNGMLNYEDFSSILECLGDIHNQDERKQKYDEVDTDSNGWISYEQYLSAIYNFDKADGSGITGLAKLAVKRAENVQFIAKLSVGEQLEYGLF